MRATKAHVFISFFFNHALDTKGGPSWRGISFAHSAHDHLIAVVCERTNGDGEAIFVFEEESGAGLCSFQVVGSGTPLCIAARRNGGWVVVSYGNGHQKNVQCYGKSGVLHFEFGSHGMLGHTEIGPHTHQIGSKFTITGA